MPIPQLRTEILCRLLMIAGCLLLLNGCYLLKQGSRILKYTTESVPIRTLQNREDTPDSLRQFLSLVQQIRRFAGDSIGLAKNKNFTSYVTIDKDYLVDVVSAAGKDNFTPYSWHYPLFGGFPYKGFFDRADARREADKLTERGYDVFIGRVDAFSTLGFFSDPLYSFMKNFSVFDLANLIFHEQTHATLFIKNKIQFNEELATFIGTQGALRFIRTTYGESSDQYVSAQKASHDADTFMALIHSLHRDLSALYESGLPYEEKVQKKQTIISAFQDSISRNYDLIFQTPSYRNLPKMTINNAFISVEMTYTIDLKIFFRLYEKKNHDLHATLASLMSLKKTKGDPNEALKKMLIQP
jgi:predicted aminopeptidase